MGVVKLLIALAGITFAALAVAQECDIATGKKVFAKCSACHSLEQGQHLMGPSLADLFGQKAAAAGNFVYSAAMASSDVIWNEETLSEFLRVPAAFIPGTTMPFAGLKDPEQRASLLCYLKQAGRE